MLAEGQQPLASKGEFVATTTDLFDARRVAEGYARYRPHLHPKVVQQIGEFLRLDEKLPHAVDVGCGTGLSTTPLADLADRVTGIDASPAMIQATHGTPRVNYLVSPAETLPLGSRSVQLVTVAGAIRWIDQGKFLPEVKRVLANPGWLVVYDFWDAGRMVDNDRLGPWRRAELLARYPKPAPDTSDLSHAVASSKGFEVLLQKPLRFAVPFDATTYANFCMTESYITSAISQRRATLPQVKRWLEQSLQTLFDGDRHEILFEGFVTCLAVAEPLSGKEAAGG